MRNSVKDELLSCVDRSFFCGKIKKNLIFSLLKNSTIRYLGRAFVFALLVNVESYFDVC